VPRRGRGAADAGECDRGHDRPLRRRTALTTSAHTEDRPRQRALDHAAGVWSATSRYLAVLLLLIALFVVFAVTQENFFTHSNIENLLTSVSILWVVSIPMTFVVLTARIDLSAASLTALSGI